MENLMPLLNLCANHLSSTAITNGDVTMVQALIEHNLFKYTEGSIKNLEVYKLLLEKNIIDSSKVDIKYTDSFPIMKFLIEDLQKPITSQLIKNILENNWNNMHNPTEKIEYIINKINKVYFGDYKTGKSSLIYSAVKRDNLPVVKLLFKFYNNNEDLRKDLTNTPYIQTKDMAKLLVEEFGYSASWISYDNTSSYSIDEYLKNSPSPKTKTYIALEFSGKQEIKIPNCVEIRKNNKYYYGYLVVDGTSVTDMKQYMEILCVLGEAKLRQL